MKIIKELQNIPIETLLRKIKDKYGNMPSCEFVEKYNELFPEEQIVMVEYGYFPKKYEWIKK